VSASRTSSSLNGLIAAMISFTLFPFCQKRGLPRAFTTRAKRAKVMSDNKPEGGMGAKTGRVPDFLHFDRALLKI